LPATDGLFLGNDSRRWDGSKLINLPSGGSHNILSAAHLDTLAAAVVAGDILFGDATPKWARLAKGANGQYLKLVSGLPAWADPPAGGGGLFLWSSALCSQLGGPSSGTTKYWAFITESNPYGRDTDSIGLGNPPRFVFASTIKKWGINVFANALEGVATFKVRKNQADTALVITFAAGETGFKSLTQDLALIDGDVINYRCNAIDPPSTHTIYFQSVIEIQA